MNFDISYLNYDVRKICLLKVYAAAAIDRHNFKVLLYAFKSTSSVAFLELFLDLTLSTGSHFPTRLIEFMVSFTGCCPVKFLVLIVL